jgi:tetratricopeptide (TPR) repeat protein
LVRRANGLYDKGAKAFAASDLGKTVAYFAAAAEVYQAAWKKKPGDPGVGTDWATSQFYAGDVARALGTIQMVLATNPDYQPALYNKGNFLAHAALLATESGQTAAAAALKERAKAAYEQAAKVDPSSDLGKRAARAAAQL